ncbi:hypothetical protein GKQ38_00490 [Candidatus Nanohaloarchaea archaeon]|nr:hypothetical protein GKQ38_00490 [Candidatus Nanohaloarchaea archaeon]
MSHENGDEKPKFGHTFEVPGSSPVGEEIRNGEITTLDDVRDARDGSDFLREIMGDHQHKLKVSSGSSGTAYGIIMGAPDAFDDMGYTVNKTEEKVFISPQNQLHQSFRQRRKEAEQNIQEQMQSIGRLRKEKHMLEHDIRKLRSRVEAIKAKDETQLKSDFIELVDGANAGSQQGGEAAMKTLQERNIYPSIVADFQEMESIEDLEEGNKLGDLPANEKAVLKKKYKMYEDWKDLYGSEVQKRLQELKGELNRVERAIEETQEWLQPYVQDMVMIDQKEQSDYYEEMTKYYTIGGYASMEKNLEFICARGLKSEEGQPIVTDDDDEITHYQIVYIHAVHVNLAGGDQPQQNAAGPATAVVFFFPAIVDKHIYEGIFKEKIEKMDNRFESLMDDYTGNFSSEKGEKLKKAREDEGMRVRELRQAIEDEIEGDVPLEVSSQIRRIEDGLDDISTLKKEYVEAIDEILDEDFSEEAESSGPDFYEGVELKLRKFLGETDRYVIDAGAALGELQGQITNSFYYDFKIGNGLNTMK